MRRRSVTALPVVGVLAAVEAVAVGCTGERGLGVMNAHARSLTTTSDEIWPDLRRRGTLFGLRQVSPRASRERTKPEPEEGRVVTTLLPRRAAMVALAVVLASTLTACGDDDAGPRDPIATGSSDSSASPSPSESATGTAPIATVTTPTQTGDPVKDAVLKGMSAHRCLDPALETVNRTSLSCSSSRVGQRWSQPSALSTISHRASSARSGRSRSRPKSPTQAPISPWSTTVWIRANQGPSTPAGTT